MDNFYQSIELTPEEIEAALLEGRKRKFFHLRSLDYWLLEEAKGVEKKEEEKRLKREKAKFNRHAKNSAALLGNK